MSLPARSANLGVAVLGWLRSSSSSWLLVTVAGLLALALCAGCKRGKSPVKSGVQKPVAPLDATALAELKTINATLTAYVNRTGDVPKDLNDAVAKGALPSLPTPPPGMRNFYDPVVPAFGFVPAE